MASSCDEFFDTDRQCFGPLSTARTARTPADMVVRPAADPAGWVAADLGPLFDELAAKCGRGRWRIGQGILARRALS